MFPVLFDLTLTREMSRPGDISVQMRTPQPRKFKQLGSGHTTQKQQGLDSNPWVLNVHITYLNKWSESTFGLPGPQEV